MALALAGCVGGGPVAIGPTGQGYGQIAPSVPVVATSSGRAMPAGAPVVQVIARLEPVLEQMCRQNVRDRSCDFSFGVDDDRTQPANAFQTLDNSGRPVIVITQSLLDMVQNRDEIAFVIGHEAAHHIAGHIPRRIGQANMGAVIAGVLGHVSGLSGDELARMQEVGAGLAAQQYSKEFELEADSLGAEIAWYAGFDPQRGAAFFARLPDPGTQSGSSHPANAQRQLAVSQTVRRLSGLSG